MARRKNLYLDASDRAAVEMEYVIKRAKKEESTGIAPAEAIKGKRVKKLRDDREITRVLFISYDTELLNPTKQSLDGYVDLKDLFEEVHILILRQGIPPKYPVMRVEDNVWIYTASAPIWWKTPGSGLAMVESQLTFANGFRPDLIVARDPFESGWLAAKLGKKYDRPTQLHILEDFTTVEFQRKDPENFWRKHLARFVIPRFDSVRVTTSVIRHYLEHKFEVVDLDILPRFQNYEALIDRDEHIDLKHKYQPFLFIMLYVGHLGHESNLFRALDAARFALINRHVGLVVLGDGPAKSEFEHRAKVLGIAPQVVFETRVRNIVPYLKSANLMIITDTDHDSEELVLKAAAAGIPMVMSKTGKREDIFTNGSSAFLCDQEDTQGFTDNINELMNNIELRNSFVAAGQDIIKKKFHNKMDEYREAYRNSIEDAFFVGIEEDESTKK